MKKCAILLFVLSAFIGCKDNPVSKKIKQAKDGVSNTTKAVTEMSKMQDDIERLREMEPLTNAEFKSWLPDNINGMKRISYKAGQAGMMNISSVDATYANEDKSKKFSVNIIDGAGQMGSAATAGMRMLMSQDFEEEDENMSRKTVEKNGRKAIEEYRNKNNRSQIQLMHGKRFYVEAKGTNMGIAETWNALDEMDLGKLD